MTQVQYQNCLHAIAVYDAMTTDAQRERFALPITLIRRQAFIYEQNLKGKK